MNVPHDALTIRPAIEEDLPVLLSLLADDYRGAARESAAGESAERVYREAFAEIQSSSHSRILVAVLDGKIVGNFTFTVLRGLGSRGGRVAMVESVRVASADRCQGIGRRMMTWAIEEAQRRGCCRIQLTTHESRKDAHRFYERLGFRPTHLGMRLAF